MKKKVVLLLATIGLLATLTFVLAAKWYFSNVVTTESVDWKVTMGNIPPESTRYQNIDLTGTVMLGNTLKSDISVTIFLALNSTIGPHMSPFPDPLIFNSVGSCLTDSTGTWNFSYNNTEPAGTILNFKAGIKK